MERRYTMPGEVKVWRFCIRLGGPLMPKEEGRLARFVGDPVWRYRDGFQGTEEEAKEAARSFLLEAAGHYRYAGPKSYEFFPWTPLVPQQKDLGFRLPEDTLRFTEEFYSAS